MPALEQNSRAFEANMFMLSFSASMYDFVHVVFLCQYVRLCSCCLSLPVCMILFMLSFSASMYDFENLPIAKSAFFKHDLKFLSHHEGVISTQNGCVSLSLGNYNPLSFTYKLLYGESCRDELGGKY